MSNSVCLHCSSLLKDYLADHGMDEEQFWNSEGKESTNYLKYKRPQILQRFGLLSESPKGPGRPSFLRRLPEIASSISSFSFTPKKKITTNQKSPQPDNERSPVPNPLEPTPTSTQPTPNSSTSKHCHSPQPTEGENLSQNLFPEPTKLGQNESQLEHSSEPESGYLLKENQNHAHNNLFPDPSLLPASAQNSIANQLGRLVHEEERAKKRESMPVATGGGNGGSVLHGNIIPENPEQELKKFPQLLVSFLSGVIFGDKKVDTHYNSRVLILYLTVLMLLSARDNTFLHAFQVSLGLFIHSITGSELILTILNRFGLTASYSTIEQWRNLQIAAKASSIGVGLAVIAFDNLQKKIRSSRWYWGKTKTMSQVVTNLTAWVYQKWDDVSRNPSFHPSKWINALHHLVDFTGQCNPTQKQAFDDYQSECFRSKAQSEQISVEADGGDVVDRTSFLIWKKGKKLCLSCGHENDSRKRLCEVETCRQKLPTRDQLANLLEENLKKMSSNKQTQLKWHGEKYSAPISNTSSPTSPSKLQFTTHTLPAIMENPSSNKGIAVIIDTIKKDVEIGK